MRRNTNFMWNPVLLQKNSGHILKTKECHSCDGIEQIYKNELLNKILEVATCLKNLYVKNLEDFHLC